MQDVSSDMNDTALLILYYRSSMKRVKKVVSEVATMLFFLILCFLNVPKYRRFIGESSLEYRVLISLLVNQLFI